MCEIAIVVVDTVNDDFYLNCQCYKSGDVICAQPDGWSWGKLDQSNPNWRILKFTGVDPLAFAQHLVPQVDIDPKNPSKTLLRRAVKFDLNALPTAPSVAANAVNAAKISPFVSDASRAIPTLAVSLSVQDVPAVTVTKAAVADPAIIGAQPTAPANVIG